MNIKNIPHSLVIYLLICTVIVLGFFRLQQIQHQNTVRYNAQAKATQIQVTKSQYALCLNGNVVRTELRDFIEKLTPDGQPVTAADQAFIAKANKAFANQDCANIIKGKVAVKVPAT